MYTLLEKNSERLVVEEEHLRSRIVRSVHDANHLGVNRTRDMISSKYYWPARKY